MKNMADTDFYFVEIVITEERLDSTGSLQNTGFAIYVPPHGYDARTLWTEQSALKIGDNKALHYPSADARFHVRMNRSGYLRLKRNLSQAFENRRRAHQTCWDCLEFVYCVIWECVCWLDAERHAGRCRCRFAQEKISSWCSLPRKYKKATKNVGRQTRERSALKEAW